MEAQGSAARTTTREEVLSRLRRARTEFDGLLAHVTRNQLEVPAPGHHHSPKEIAAHVSSYEQMVADTIRSMRCQESHAYIDESFDWQSFDDQVWEDATRVDAEYVLENSAHVFNALVDEITRCTEDLMNAPLGMRLLIDEAWMIAETVADLALAAAADHYPRHYEALEGATRQPPL